jgi:hypothetical protein
VEYGRLALSYPLFGPASPDLRYENLYYLCDLYYLYHFHPKKILKLPQKNT